MTSRDDHPSTQEQPEYQPPQEEGQVEEARQSPSSSEEHSLGHESLHEVTIAYESQSSIRSDITFHSHIRPTGGDDVESDVRTSTDHAESSGSLTFHPHPLERIPGETDPGGQLIGSPPASPSQRPFGPEIREATSSDNDQDSTNDKSQSEVSIVSSVPGPVPRTIRPNYRKRIWMSLKGGCGNLRKRLCRCLSPKAAEQKRSSDEEGLRIKDLDLKKGILQSRVQMNSFTAQQVEEVIIDHGGFVVLSGEKLEKYERRMNTMLDTCFDRRRGYEVLRLWKLDAVRPSRLYAEMLPSAITENRFLTLEDVRLLNPPREDPYDRRDDSLFRYFMSYEGLSGRMLIPGRG